MKKIRILHVGLDTNLGGIETYILKISTYIDKNQFEFAFLAYDNIKPCFYDELSNMGFKFYFVRSRRKSLIGNRTDLKNLFRKEHFDILHYHLNSLTYITPITLALHSGIRVIAHSRNAGAFDGSSSKTLCIINKLIFPYSKVTLVAVSDKAGEWMFGKKKKILVLNNGLNTELYRFSENDRIRIRKELKIEDKEVLIHVGAFRKQKNHRLLITIFDAYYKVYGNSVLLLVGEGELMDEIKKEVRKKGLGKEVFFLGKRRDLPSLLSSADKFVFPSLYEGFPNALIEAEASGLSCVVSSSITKQACLGNTICVDLNAPLSSWVSALSNMSITNRKEYADIVEEKGFGIESEIQRLESLYKKLCR